MLGRSLITLPESGCSAPAMICSCVVLPAPLMPAGQCLRVNAQNIYITEECFKDSRLTMLP